MVLGDAGRTYSSLSRGPTLQGENIESGYGSVFVKSLNWWQVIFRLGNSLLFWFMQCFPAASGIFFEKE